MANISNNLYYPFGVEFKQDGNQRFLVENGNKYTKPHSLLGLRLEIFELNSTIEITNTGCCEKLSGKARLYGILESISLFGCDRNLEYVDITISSEYNNIKNLRKLAPIGFVFVGWETTEFSSIGQSVGEGVSIRVYTHNLQFQKIKHLLEKNLITKLILNVPTSNIEGLYESYYGIEKYKILGSKERIINKNYLPTDFTDTSYRLYKEKFYIHTTEKSSFDLNKTLNSEDKNECIKLIKEDTSNTFSIDTIIYLNKIKINLLKYIPYCFWALVMIIAKLYS
jgi:hypothetical protein